MAPPCRIHLVRAVREAQPPQDRDRLCDKYFVQLDDLPDWDLPAEVLQND